MRFLLLFSILATAVFATDSVVFFKKSPDNQLLCHLSQYSFKVVSQKNALIKNMDDHMFFKLKDENLYFFKTACQPLKDKKEPIIF